MRNCGWSLAQRTASSIVSVTCGRDLESLQVRRRDGQHAVSGGGEIFGEPDQAGFVDAVAMHARNQHAACVGLPCRTEEARRDVAAACRHA